MQSNIKCAKCFDCIRTRNAVYLLDCKHCIHVKCKPVKEYNCFYSFCNTSIFCKICKINNKNYKLLLTP